MQRHIGDAARQSDDRDQPRHHHVMAETRSDKVRGRRRLCFAQGLGQAPQETRRQRQQTNRRQINGQKIPPLAHHAAHRAIDGPTGAIDPQRQRIGAQTQVLEAPPPTRQFAIGLGNGRHGKQQADPAQGKQRRRTQSHAQSPCQQGIKPIGWAWQRSTLCAGFRRPVSIPARWRWRRGIGPSHFPM